MNYHVMRVRTRETLNRPDVAQLILRGAQACGFPDPAAILAELAHDPGRPQTGLFVGLVGSNPRVIAVGFLPVSAFWLAATVGMAYSHKAPRELVTMVERRVRNWFVESGADHVIVENLLHSDRSYIRGLKHFGGGSRIGSTMRFDFT